MSHDSIIQRSPHDKKNPYVMVDNKLIKDPNLSPQCRWLLIFLLSHPDGWEIKTSYIQNHLKGHKGYGRDSVRNLIKEAITAGYMEVEHFAEGNLRRMRYFVSEEPRFSKNVSDALNSRGPECRGPECRGPQTRAVINELEEVNTYKNITPCVTTPKGDADVKRFCRNMESYEKAKTVAELMFSKIKKVIPEATEPNFLIWAQDLDRMHRLDKISWEAITEMFDWVNSDPFWRSVVLSPKKLREKWNQLLMKRSMKSPNKNQPWGEINRDEARRIRDVLVEEGRSAEMKIYNGFIMCDQGATLMYNMNPDEFSRLIRIYFNINESAARH